MKKALLILAVILAIALVAAFIFRNELQFAMMMMALQPEQSFAEDTRHAAPDYANPDHWAALPDREDLADVSPAGTDLDAQANAPADVFFIHPTTYYTSDHWNQPLDHAATNTFTDEQVLRSQASVFNSCCRIYAPRYRQATLYAFMDQGSDGPAAIDFAYADVKAAFKYFIDHYNQDRPFILAGHSQGGKHVDTLLQDIIAGTELQARMIAAYPVGYFLDGSNGIPVCSTPTQTGCQATWNSVAPEAPSFQDTSKSICVNPLNWKNDGTRADFSENSGAVAFNAKAEIEQGVVDAQCVDGKLIVSEVRSDNYDARMFGPGNYHIFDFSFFHMDLRKNAEDRVAAFVDP
jgi:hypothetical protein